MITHAQVAEICKRSAAGEGVIAIIAAMGLPSGALDYLRDNHSADIKEAKQAQTARGKGVFADRLFLAEAAAKSEAIADIASVEEPR